MYGKWINSLEEDNLSSKGKLTLRAYLNKSVTASDAARSLVTSSDTQGLNHGSVENLDVVLIEASQEIPDSQLMLVELVEALRQLPYVDLTKFGRTMRDCWNFSDLPASDPSQQEHRADWLSINAFAARLTATSSFPDSGTSFALFGLWTLRSALEDEQELDANIPAAAQWVLFAGGKLYTLEEEYKPKKGGGDPGRGGKLWKGRRGFSLERWAFWKEKFQKFSEGQGDSKTKEYASMAWKQMLEVEGEK